MENKNQYGVQVGDIFSQYNGHEDWRGYSFYQVVALRGKTQVEVRTIGSKRIAFDGNYEEIVPVPNAWVSEESLVRKVQEGGENYRAYIRISSGWYCSGAFLRDDEQYLTWTNGPSMAYYFREYNPELAAQLHLEDGSGVYAVDKPFVSMGDDCPALIRYPDGREEKVILRELLHYEEQMQLYKKFNSVG